MVASDKEELLFGNQTGVFDHPLPIVLIPDGVVATVDQYLW